MKKIVYIISDTHKSLQFEWIAEGLDKSKLTQYYILLNEGDSEFEQFLISKGFYVKRISTNNPIQQLSCLIKLVILLLKIAPHSVHYHLYKASFLGSIASFLTGIKQRVLTRHHASYHREYYPKAVKKDKFINYLSTHIIAISKNVEKELMKYENVPLVKISIIHHGLNFNIINQITEQRIHLIKQKYAFTSKGPVIGVISRYIFLKGIQYIIPAFKKLLINYPDANLVLANTSGNYSKEIKQLLNNMLPKNSYTEIVFESDLFALYHTFNMFIHVPINEQCEAFGQIYTESLACSVPSIVTLSGVAPEFIEDKKNALVVPFKNTEAIYNAMIELLTNNELKQNIIKKGKQSIVSDFDIKHTIKKLQELYLN